jgi:hypothetical protein
MKTTFPQILFFLTVFFNTQIVFAESLKLSCLVYTDTAIPCTEAKFAELEKKGMTKEKVLVQPKSCGVSKTTEVIDVNISSPKMLIGSVNAQICSGQPVNGKEAKFKENCDPIEDDYKSERGFIEGRLTFYGPYGEGAVAEWNSDIKKMLLPNSGESTMAKVVIPPSSVVASSVGKCFPSSMRAALLSKVENDKKEQIADNLKAAKYEALQAKYANAPVCDDLMMTPKYKKNWATFKSQVMAGDPPEPCLQCSPPGNCKAVLPKKMTK